MTAPLDQVIDVVAAVRHAGPLFWLAQRSTTGRHGGLAGMWEYPGGKVERGESHHDALRREMREEFGVEIDVGPRLDAIDSGPYLVTFYAVDFLGIETLTVHQDARWFRIPELDAHRHLPSGQQFNHRLRRGQYDAVLGLNKGSAQPCR